MIILIGGVGTLHGTLACAVILYLYLLDFGLRRYLGESASFVNGAIYVLIVLFLPYGVAGTRQLKASLSVVRIRQGWQWLLEMAGVNLERRASRE